MGLLGEAEFLEALRRLYENNRSKNSGSVWITFKRTFPEVGGSRGVKRRRKLHSCEERPEATPVCLVRATDGKKKISVQVEGERASRFSEQLLGISRHYTDQVKPTSPAAIKGKQRKQQQQPNTQRQLSQKGTDPVERTSPGAAKGKQQKQQQQPNTQRQLSQKGTDPVERTSPGVAKGKEQKQNQQQQQNTQGRLSQKGKKRKKHEQSNSSFKREM
ncbi:signal recognition particle 14 kDa protein, putative [Eimeria maxima]|uniref:Signal recognition particle 14 kDa protein n=1 Tax=Eimeria maxima TaxID=5804 RepID=U6MGY9_EIMMA|nr:signal recognition particle 14 kDa protein, putative [Eimeria maxima]CDJ60910.1 signal recognition particle 14 kDa protein, putative [Eimeria maxima]